MTDGVKDLINAIASGNSQDIDQAFNSEMSARISDRLDIMRQDLAQSMFSEKKTAFVEEIEQIDEARGGRVVRDGNSIHVYDEKDNHIGTVDHLKYQSGVTMHPLHHLGGEHEHGYSHEPHPSEDSTTIDGPTRKERDTPEKNRAAIKAIRQHAKDIAEDPRAKVDE